MLPRIGVPLKEVARASEWWEYKLVPIFALVYASALTAGAPLTSLWRVALVILLALAPGAMYVSIINDLTDRDEDRAAGKHNRMEGRSPAVVAALLVVTTLPGFVFAWLWRDDVALLTAYLAAWLVYSLYSLPPFRMKTRGIFGVLCDATGAHLFPTLVAVLLVYRDLGQRPQAAWLAAVTAWSLGYGIRGILWHQLHDRENDRKAGVRTFAERHPPAVSERLATFGAFPLELAGLAVLLVLMASPWPLLFLALYVVLSILRWRRWGMQPVIVTSPPRFFLVLHEYYDVFFPIAIIVAAALRNPGDLVVLALHVLLFPRRAGQVWHDARTFARI